MKVKIVILNDLNNPESKRVKEVLERNPDIEFCEEEDLFLADFSTQMSHHLPLNLKNKEQIKLSEMMEDKQCFKRYDYKKLPLKGRRR